LIQPLLLLKQSRKNYNPDVPLITNGEYKNFGNFIDIVYNHDKKKTIEIGIDFYDHCDKCEKNDCKVKIKLKENREESKLGDLPPMRYILDFITDENNNPIVKSVQIYDCLDRILLIRNRLDNGTYDCNFRLSFEEEELYIKEIINNQKPINFLFNQTQIFRNIMRNQEEKIKPKNSKFELSKVLQEYLFTIDWTDDQITSIIQSIKYIGPIREYPKRIYEYNNEVLGDVGKFGGNVANLLFQNRKDKIKEKLLKEWLNIFEFAKDFKIESLKNHPELISLQVKTLNSDIFINFADVFFGFSQLLPILTQVIYSKKQDIIIIEQPELHLNPYLESILGDFFAKMVDNNKCIIIETHSEHFFQRLRTNIKRGIIDQKDVSIYFNAIEDDKCIIRKIEIDENGNFPNNDWPKNFFNQALSESLMFATTKKG
jgi:predicted ATP-dependent endonuclease of OLD family